jgi:hypothetical protein
MLTAIIFGEIVAKFATGAVAALWRTKGDKGMSVHLAGS